MHLWNQHTISHDAKLGVCRTIWLHVADCATLQLFNG